MKIALGTAQFGMDYGVNNKRGKIPKEEVFEIFSYAHNSGIDSLDTASAYGDSEKIIGEFHKKTKKKFRIISKFSFQGLIGNIKQIAEVSIKNLQVDCLDGYYIHNFNEYREFPYVLDALHALKAEGKIKKTGFSLYYPEEMEFILKKDLKIDAVQIPYNIFDRRFESFFEELKRKDIEINVRSIFLQGLVFKNPQELNEIITKTTDKIQLLNDLSQKEGMPVFAACLNFVLANDHIDSAIVGVDSIDNLKEILTWPVFRHAFLDIKQKLLNLKINDEQIIIPLNWKTMGVQTNILDKSHKVIKKHPFKIGNKQISEEELFFVVEEGQANQGDFKKALAMVDAAALSGADAIEFQLSKAGDFYVKSHPGHEVYLKREFTDAQIKELIAYTKNKGLEFIAVPLSHRLIKPLVESGCSAFNINASDMTNPEIIDAVADSGLPFFLSLPLASDKEIDWAIDRIKKSRTPHFALLHGQHAMSSGKPGVDPEHATLGFISTLKEKYRVPVGFIDHTSLPWFPAVAVAAGAVIVSKHMALSRADKGPDWSICLEPDEMKEAIDWARKVHKAILVKSKVLAPGEDVDKTAMRRSIVAAKNLKKGKIIQRQDICFKRPGTGFSSSRCEEVIGKRLMRDIRDDEQIKPADLEG